MSTLNRRYDIDWLRVIAIGLLLIYHIGIGFQPWGLLIGFIQSGEALPSLWTPMTMLNVWRIPLLFFVSGMGVSFAMRKRNWLSLVKERTVRILVPFLFGMVAIVPLHVLILLDHYGQSLKYISNPGHLWFLGNIFVYVLVFSPIFFWLKNKPEHRVSKLVKRLFGSIWGLLLAIGIMVLEVLIVNPTPFELYAMTWHGFFMGLAAFFLGFCFVYSGEAFWKMMRKGKWIFLLLALGLYILRFLQFNTVAPGYLMSIESCLWIFSAFGLAYQYLNRPSKALTYLSQAAYPIYIIHMAMLYGASYLIFPTNLPIELQFILVVLITTGGCFIVYEFLIRRVWLLRPLFGLKLKKKATTTEQALVA